MCSHLDIIYESTYDPNFTLHWLSRTQTERKAGSTQPKSNLTIFYCFDQRFTIQLRKIRTEWTKNFLIYILFSERVFHVICLLISKKSTFILVPCYGRKKLHNSINMEIDFFINQKASNLWKWLKVSTYVSMMMNMKILIN